MIPSDPRPARPRPRAARRAHLLGVCLLSTLGASCSLFRADAPFYTPIVTSSGILIQDRVVPEGIGVALGQRVTVHYEGRLETGEVFDSSYESGLPAIFELGAGEVPAGLEEGVLGMVVGGRRELTLPPDLAFGAEGIAGRVPPAPVVQFDVELLDAE